MSDVRTARKACVAAMRASMEDADLSDRRFAARGRLVLALIGIMIAIQGLRSVLSTDADTRLILTFAFVPASLTRLFDGRAVANAASVLIGQDGASAQDIVLLLGPQGFRWWTPFTYALLHGGWTHVLVNAVWLAAFGSAVARRFGGPRFLLFFFVTALGGVAAHCITHAQDFAPLVGASAAISGAMAAAARFAFAPGAPLGPNARRGTLDAYEGAPLPLRAVLRDTRVMTFLATWFGANFMFGALMTPVGIADASIAWEAHIGGFVTGFLLFRLFDPVRGPSDLSETLPPSPPPAP